MKLKRVEDGGGSGTSSDRDGDGGVCSSWAYHNKQSSHVRWDEQPRLRFLLQRTRFSCPPTLFLALLQVLCIFTLFACSLNLISDMKSNTNLNCFHCRSERPQFTFPILAGCFLLGVLG